MTWDDLTWEQKRGAVLAQALFMCELCAIAAAEEVDHIWPKSKGGTDERGNLRATCRPCNRKKGDAIYIADLDADPTLLTMGVERCRDDAYAGIFGAINWALTLRLMRGGRSAEDADLEAVLDDAAAMHVVSSVHDLISEVTDRRYDDITQAPTPLSLPALPEGLTP